jgi:hypothetical protein
VQRVEELIRADRRITIDSVATTLGCSYGAAYSIMHDRLKFWKVYAHRTEGLIKINPEENSGTTVGNS